MWEVNGKWFMEGPSPTSSSHIEAGYVPDYISILRDDVKMRTPRRALPVASNVEPADNSNTVGTKSLPALASPSHLNAPFTDGRCLPEGSGSEGSPVLPAEEWNRAMWWRGVTADEPSIGVLVIATDGVARWMDRRVKGMDMDFYMQHRRHVATQWHPVADVPRPTQDTNTPSTHEEG